ncbi:MULTISPECIES: SDR family NAD(P)-dependent oxidoreductase [unclassified Vreelandella]
MLKDKVVLVTGGAGAGIGRAVAKQVLAEGGKVVLTDLRHEALEQVAKELDAPESVIYMAADASSLDSMNAIVAKATETFGGLDAVIACAGTVQVGNALELSEDAWRLEMTANLDTAFITAKAAMPALIERKGKFVIMSSLAGLQAMPSTCGYVTAKHALIGLMRSLAVDFGPQGVCTNAICPGWIRTPMADEEMQPVMERESLSLEGAYELVTSDTPLQRAGDPSEVADLCCFLASDRASLINGSVFSIDGGATATCLQTLKL